MKVINETIEIKLIGISANEFLDYIRKKYNTSAYHSLNVSSQILTMYVEKDN